MQDFQKKTNQYLYLLIINLFTKILQTKLNFLQRLDLHQKILNLPNTRIENLSTKPHSPHVDINLASHPRLWTLVISNILQSQKYMLQQAHLFQLPMTYELWKG